MKTIGGKLLEKENLREDTAPVQEVFANQESEVSPLYGLEGAEERAPSTRNLWVQPREITLANKKKREDELDACVCAITNIYIAKKK